MLRQRWDDVEASRDLELPGLTLRPYQVVPVGLAGCVGKRLILADDMGLGKTIVSLAVAHRSGSRTIVICTAGTRLNWASEAQRALGLEGSQIGVLGLAPRRSRPLPYRLIKRPTDGIPDDVQLAIVNYDILGRWVWRLQRGGFDLMVCDEAQAVCDPDSRRAALVRYLAHGVQSAMDLERILRSLGVTIEAVEGGSQLVKGDWRGSVGPRWGRSSHPRVLQARIVEAAKAKVVPPLVVESKRWAGIDGLILSTGTPAPHRLENWWHLLHLVDNVYWNDGNDLSGFRRRFCGWYDVPGLDFPKQDPSRANPDDLHKIVMGRWVVRRTKEQLRDQIPPKARYAVHLDVETGGEYGELMGRYVQLKEQWKETKDPEVLIERLTLLAQLRAALGVAKVGPAVDWIAPRASAESPMVVFAWHKAVQRQLADGLEERGLVVQRAFAGMPAADVEASKRLFQGGTGDVFVLSLGAFKEGITLHRANQLALVERSWRSGDNDQAEDRINRLGQERDCSIFTLIAAGTFDVAQHEALTVAADLLSRAAAGRGRDPVREYAMERFDAMLEAP